MARARQLRAIWDYLPAFRVVAEAEHLPTAARALHVSASSLSRAIRIAEDRVGVPLFERTGGRLRLNPAGQALLGSVRIAMRVVDEGLATLAEAGLVGRVVVAASADVASWLATPALARMREREPGLLGELVGMPAAPAVALRRGDVDVVIGVSVPAGDDLEVEALTSMRWALHAARGRRGRVRELVHVAGAPAPAQHRLQIAAVVADTAMAAAACQHGLLAWLPLPLAAMYGLVRVPGPATALTTIHAAWRRPVAAHARTEALLEALRAIARPR